jgi:hypothetical protein
MASNVTHASRGLRADTGALAIFACVAASSISRRASRISLSRCLGSFFNARRSQRLGFSLESAHTLRIVRKFFWQDFDRYIAFEFGIVSTIDLAHAALSDESHNFVRADMLSDL